MNLVELVPRDLEALKTEAHHILNECKAINGINIPDVLRLPNRSHTSAELLLSHGVQAIPHIRAMDRPEEETIAIIERLIQKGLNSVLIVAGDKPNQIGFNTYPITPIMVVEKLKIQFPELRIYCGLDPYRDSFKKELEYCRMKLHAGADGFFTQPFFDKDLARIYLEQFSDTPLFVGISPVLTEQSYNYWVTKNNAIFPSSFALDLDTNFRIGKEIIETAKKFNQNTYLMPIKMDAFEYVKGIFNSV